jgi:hypothetical protein
MAEQVTATGTGALSGFGEESFPDSFVSGHVGSDE